MPTAHHRPPKPQPPYKTCNRCFTVYRARTDQTSPLSDEASNGPYEENFYCSRTYTQDSPPYDTVRYYRQPCHSCRRNETGLSNTEHSYSPPTTTEQSTPTSADLPYDQSPLRS